MIRKETGCSDITLLTAALALPKIGGLHFETDISVGSMPDISNYGR